MNHDRVRVPQPAAAAPTQVTDTIGQPGRPLEPAVRDVYGKRLGHDFGDVRVHSDDRAARSAAAVGAAAYTVGEHVVFGQDRYVPSTADGDRLLMHELTHVAQDGRRYVPGVPVAVGDRHAPAEHAADAGRADRAATAGPLILRRQTGDDAGAGAAPTGSGPGPDDDPLDSFDYPGYGWWLISGDYTTEPSLADAIAEVARYRPDLTLPLAESTPQNFRGPAGDVPYWVLRHPTRGVVARIYASRSGRSEARGTIYGIYMLLPDAEGERLHGIGAPTSPGGAATGERERATSPAAATDPLLDVYFREFPSEPGGTPVTSTNLAMRIRLALTVADRTLWGEFAGAALEAITSPLFIAQTIGLIIVYVGLWLVPDPSFVTKVAAAALTAVLLTMFAWNDIVGFARAWWNLMQACDTATTEDQLRVAGNAFLTKLGQVGFDVFIMILFWGLARAARPSLSAARASVASRAVLRAETTVAEARAAPGSGARGVPAEPAAAETQTAAVRGARQAAGDGATSGRVLDELAQRLPEGNRDGLAARRTQLGDDAALRAIEAEARAGRDLGRWLDQARLTPEETAAAVERLADAQAALVRARAVELRALEDAALRRTVRAEFLRNLLDFGRALLRGNLRLRNAIRNGSVTEVVGELGEALARAMLRRSLPAGSAFEVRSGYELVRRVSGYRTIAEWAAAEGATGRDVAMMRQGADGVYRSVGQIDNLVGERTADGRIRVTEVEETKTGSETGQSASAQVTGVRDTLNQIHEGTTDVRVYERTGRTTVGADVTNTLDLSGGAEIAARTRGPAGRSGFDRSLEVSREDLASIARQLLTEGLPPGEPGAARRVETMGEREREGAPTAP